ncbi:MAG: hypothetical protein JSR66_27105 [Proteobacteria bacterium]|nr:hypothetical protein [Pseudomonadota bacterium]
MNRLPLVIASSVIRGSRLGESHGGLYLVDLETGRTEQTLDWNHTDIDISGRGGDRGLRGIAFYGPRMLVAANSSLLMLDRDCRVMDTFTNPFLRHCHEISAWGDHLFLTSTGFDSLLVFDLVRRRFSHAFCLSVDGHAPSLRAFDPEQRAGPAPSRHFHLNSVHASPDGISFSGLHTPSLLCLRGQELTSLSPLPKGTHNAQPFAGGVMYNDTVQDRVCYRHSGGRVIEIPVPQFAQETVVNLERWGTEVARPGFARGLCGLNDHLVAGGSSPSTVALYDIKAGRRVSQHNLSMDVRNAIHGLAVWPF